MKRDSLKTRNAAIVADRLVGGPDAQYVSLAKKYKLSASHVSGICKDHAHEVQTPPRDGELALAGTSLFAGQDMMPFNPSLLVSRKGMGIFDEMRKDEQVKAALWFKKLAVLSTGWEVISPEDQPPDWEVTRFVQEQLDHIEGSFSSSLIEVLSALDFGFSVSELVFNDIEEGEFSGKIGLRAIKSKRPHSMFFRTDDFGNLRDDGLVQKTIQGDAFLPVSKFIIFSYQREFSNWYGRSDLESAYRAWWIKENAYRWLAQLLERFGIPPIFALYDPQGLTPAQIDALLNTIDKIQGATAGAIPRSDKDSLEMWSPQLAGQVTRVFVPALDMFNRDIARALLMPGLLGMSPSDKVGSFARARVEFDVFLLMINQLRHEIQDHIVMDQVVRPLVRLNFADVDSFPIFRLLPVTDETRIDIMKQWSEFVNLGVVTSSEEDEDHIRALFGFPDRDESLQPRRPVGPGEEGGVPPEEGGEVEPSGAGGAGPLSITSPLVVGRNQHLRNSILQEVVRLDP